MRCRLDAIGVDARRKQDRDERRADRDELTEFAPLGQKDSNPHRMAPKAIVLPLDHVPGSQPRHPTTVRKGFEPLVLVENYSLASCHLQPLGHLTMVSRNAQRATQRTSFRIMGGGQDVGWKDVVRRKVGSSVAEENTPWRIV